MLLDKSQYISELIIEDFFNVLSLYFKYFEFREVYFDYFHMNFMFTLLFLQFPEPKKQGRPHQLYFYIIILKISRTQKTGHTQKTGVLGNLDNPGNLGKLG